jgi:hypothetical protein
MDMTFSSVDEASLARGIVHVEQGARHVCPRSLAARRVDRARKRFVRVQITRDRARPTRGARWAAF